MSLLRLDGRAAYTKGVSQQEIMQLDHEQRLYFRDAFRAGRAKALKDSEGFGDVIFALERLGRLVAGSVHGLGRQTPALSLLATRSPLAEGVPDAWPEYHAEFSNLLKQLREARNAAFHEGAFARHLTTHAVIVALVLEDALMTDLDTVGDFMVRMPVCACMWHPMSFVRQTLLGNSFSFLPVDIRPADTPEWRLVSDARVAEFLRSGNRAARLKLTLDQAVQAGLTLQQPHVCDALTPVADALARCQGLPILVTSNDGSQLLGIATPFDLL